ncbi:hypothetical protein F5X96DRAFT_673665 [Biscogniauxia mediterranea]|nr:hypothetical protein F5X96DRAFT_673665 [Biscogniauxia mediterranea]
MTETLNTYYSANLSKKQVKNKYRYIGNKARAWVHLVNTSGFGWDEERKTISGDLAVIDAYMAGHLERATGLRAKGLYYDNDDDEIEVLEDDDDDDGVESDDTFSAVEDLFTRASTDRKRKRFSQGITALLKRRNRAFDKALYKLNKHYVSKISAFAFDNIVKYWFEEKVNEIGQLGGLITIRDVVFEANDEVGQRSADEYVDDYIETGDSEGIDEL